MNSKFDELMILTKNAAQCLLCNDVIESTYRHDYVSCKCGAIFIDGGTSYLRCGGDFNNFKSLAESRFPTKEEILVQIERWTGLFNKYGSDFDKEKLSLCKEYLETLN